MRFLVSLFLTGLMTFASVASAGDTPMELMGSWKESGDNGVILWDFAPDKIAVSPLDADGKPLGDPSQIDVVYERGRTGWAIIVQAQDGSPIGEGAAKIDQGTMTLLMPGIGTHQLKRVDAKPDAKAPAKTAPKKGAK